MPLLLLLLFIGAPLVELYVLIRVGSAIGALNTIALCILTAAAGTLLLRQQGLSTLARVQETMNRGELPAVELIEGLMLLVSGLMLITPGFVTDAIGFACLVPALRRGFALGLAERFFIQRIHVHRPGPHPEQRTLEGDYRVDRDED